MQIEPVFVPVVYGLAVVFGLLSCFFGLKVFKLFLVFVFSFVGAALLAVIGFHFGDQPLLWSMIGFFCGGILGALMAVFFFTLAVGIGGAFTVAALMLPWIEALSIPVQVTAIAIGSAGGALLAISLTRIMIQMISAFLGSFMLVNGVRYWMTGEKVLVEVGEGEAATVVVNLSQTAALIALAIGVVGFLWQRFQSR